MKFFNLIKNFQVGHKRSIEAKKNILYSFLLKSISILISLLFVPLTISYVNAEQYGIWLTLSSIIAWFSFFDIGMTNGFRNHFAKAIAEGKIYDARIYVSSTYFFISIIFVVLWFFFISINFFIDWSSILNASKNLSNELSSVALILFSFFCLQMILKLINTILIADQKPYKSSLVDLISQFLILLIIYFLTVYTKGSLVLLALTLGIVPVIVLFSTSIFLYKSSYQNFSPSFKYIRFEKVKKILSLGGKFFLIQIAFIVIYQTSNFIISNVSGPVDVTNYNIAYKYFAVLTMLFNIVITPYWSAFTDAFTLNDYNWMKKTYFSLLKLYIPILIINFVMVVVSPIVYDFWVGELVNVTLMTSILISIYISLNIWNSLHSYIINGIGKIKLQLYYGVLSCLIFLPLAFFLGDNYGVYGVISASILISLPQVFISFFQVYKLINKKATGIWNE